MARFEVEKDLTLEELYSINEDARLEFEYDGNTEKVYCIVPDEE